MDSIGKQIVDRFGEQTGVGIEQAETLIGVINEEFGKALSFLNDLEKRHPGKLFSARRFMHKGVMVTEYIFPEWEVGKGKVVWESGPGRPYIHHDFLYSWPMTLDENIAASRRRCEQAFDKMDWQAQAMEWVEK